MPSARRPAACGGSTGPAGLRRRVAIRTAAPAAVITVLASGCATMPTTGPVQPFAVVQGGSGQTRDNPLPIPVPPGAGWRPDQIVTGFLAASTSFPHNHAVARAYLAPSTRQKWRPGWAATVVGPAPKVTIVAPPRNVVPGGHVSATVKFTGQHLATLTSSGQYLTSSQPKEADSFTLVKINGQWRISRLPSLTTLLLTKPDFQRDYLPRNLYFFAPSGASLVPDPVFVPQQDTSAEPAQGLVNALRKGPTGWLSWAAKTDFPAGTRILGVKIVSNSAVVDLGGAAAKASPQVLSQIAAQLVWTLTSTSYSTPAIKSVVLEINHQVQHPHGTQYQVLSMYRGLMPASPAGGAFFLSSSGGIKVLPGGGQPARQAAEPADISRLAFTAIAVSPGGGHIAGIVPQSKGCLVYSGTLQRDAALTHRQLNSGTCTALSWDNKGNIWAAAGGHVWMLPPGASAAVPVFLPGASALAGPSASLPPSGTIVALRVAPDGARVAMIVRGKNGSADALLGAISRAGHGSEERTYIGRNGLMVSIGADVPSPSALTWYDADHVLVLGQQAGGALLYNVPLTGGASVPILPPPGTVSITAEGPNLVAGTSGDQILISSGSPPNWRLVGHGRAPAYPG